MSTTVLQHLTFAHGIVTSGVTVSVMTSGDAASATSGSIGSGLIASGSVPGYFGPYRAIQSGTVGVYDLGSGAVVAGQIGSGAVQSGNVASGSLGVYHMQSGLTTSGLYLSGSIGSGQLGFIHFQSGLVTSGLYLSGSIGSGQIGTVHFASGSYFKSGTIGLVPVNSGDGSRVNIPNLLGEDGAWHLWQKNFAPSFVTTDETTTKGSGVDLTTTDGVTFFTDASASVAVRYIAQAYSPTAGALLYSVVLLDGSVQLPSQFTTNAIVSDVHVHSCCNVVAVVGSGTHTIKVQHFVGSSGQTGHWLNRFLEIQRYA